jgi:hypothetical protein
MVAEIQHGHDIINKCHLKNEQFDTKLKHIRQLLLKFYGNSHLKLTLSVEKFVQKMAYQMAAKIQHGHLGFPCQCS